MNEVWKPVTFKNNIYKDRYEVSNLGRVRRTLKPISNDGSYLHLKLSHNGNRTQVRIHQLVAHEFLGERPKGFDVDHLDGNRQNNTVENLEYVTPQENTRRKVKRLKRKVSKI